MVVSLAGLPASPKAPATPKINIISAVLKPSSKQIGQKSVAMIGIVPKKYLYP